MKNKTRIIEKVNTRASNTLLSALDIKITDIGNNFVCGKMPVNQKTKQPFGFLHGGASVALAETLGSIGGGLQIDQKKENIVGIEINASHLKSIKKGWVFGKATSVRIGRKIQVWEILITDTNKNIICKSRLTLAVITKK